MGPAWPPPDHRRATVTRHNRGVARIRPLSPAALVAELAGRVLARAGASGLRVAVDGPVAADPDGLADALVDPLRAAGRPAVRVRAADYLRPASLRYERGRTDPDSFYEDWLDVDGLRRDVLDPMATGGSGRVRLRRWDADRDRAHRDGFTPVAPGGVLVLSGPLLLGGALSFDYTVHIDLSPAALARRTPADQAWTLPAYARYAEEVDPAGLADCVIRWDDVRRPALLD
jgi:hypothetical protein